MVWQLAEPEYKAKKEFPTGESVGALRRHNRAPISGLHPTAHERHGHEQRSAIAFKLLFGYLNCRPRNIVVKYSNK